MNTYIERYANNRRISIAEAATHEVVKEYYRNYPEELQMLRDRYSDAVSYLERGE